MKSRLQQLQQVLKGSHLVGKDVAFEGVTTDSRKIMPGNLFVALRGERFDAHDFLKEVERSAAVAVVAERIPAEFSLPALIVPDARVALGEMAQYWRQQFDIPVIGVTGSNGKTTVKEMIASILAVAYGEKGYLATLGNLNNEVGVPLTLFRMQASHQAAVIEMGMNHPGEIAWLSAIAQPTVGLVNNAQREHQEFMHSVEAVAEENGAVIHALSDNGIAVFPVADQFATLWRKYAAQAGHRKVVTFGMTAQADVQGKYLSGAATSMLSLQVGDGKVEVPLAVVGEHHAMNALAATACALAIGIDIPQIVEGLAAFRPVSGRMEQKQAASGAVVIDDTYNANPDSVRAAIDVLSGMPAPRVLVLGDMGEVGDAGKSFHEEIGHYAREKGIEHVGTLGKLSRWISEACGAKARHFDDVKSLTAWVLSQAVPGATVLVKGSRFMQMERVVHALVRDEVGEKD